MKLLFKSKNIIIIFIYFISCNLVPGSYPYAKEYNIDVGEPVFISAIEKFLNKNPKYQIPPHIKLHNGRKNINDHWYFIHFYYPETKQILKCWTRPAVPMELEEIGVIESLKSTFAFISVNDELDIGNWKRINKDFEDDENEKQIQHFEERILNKIKTYLKETK